MLNINGTTLFGMKDTLVIPNGIDVIEENAFRECMWIKHIQFPMSVRRIKFGAFYHCTSIENIDLPSIRSIDNYTFSGCVSLKTVNIPEGVEEIGDFAFAGCRDLEEVHIPSTVHSIAYNAFDDCVSLKKITVESENVVYSSDGTALLNKDETKLMILPAGCVAYKIPNKINHIVEDACYRCVKIKDIVIPNSVKSIDSRAFSGCVSLEKVTLPCGLKTIENGVFKDCISLVDVSIPDSIEKIESHAFKGCSSLSKIDIPNSVTSIKDGAFSYCSKLQEIDLSNKLNTINSDLFSYCLSLEKIDLKNVSDIYNGAFNGCCALKEIVMNNVKLSQGIGEPFKGCTSLTFRGIKAPLGVAGEIVNSIVTNATILNGLSSHQMSPMFAASKKKTELINGVWEDYLK